MNRINALSAIKTVGSATSGSSNKQIFQQHIKRGQTFTATVMEPAGKNRFYLNILDNKILAQSDALSLPSGSTITLEVINTTPLLELKIVSKTPELFFGKTLTLLGKSLNIEGLFQSLTSVSSPLLNQLSPTTQKGLNDFNNLQHLPVGDTKGGAYLKQLLERSGLSLEGLLAGGQKNLATQTLKAALLEVATLMKDGTELAETTSQLLGTLQLYQLAQLQLATDNLLIYPLPLPFLDNGYLLVEKNKDEQKQNADKKSTHYSVHLSLEPLGNLEVTFFQTHDGLYLTFASESDNKKEFLHDNENLLNEMLLSTDLLGISFTSKAGDPTSELIQKLVPSGETMLDTKI